MLFRQFIDPASSTYTYLLADDETHEAILIDPVAERVDRELALIDELGLTLRWVLETHRHTGSASGAELVAQRTGARTVAREGANVCVAHGDVIRFGAHRIEVLATPGHTKDSVSYRIGRRIFTGDALLVRGCGKADEGDAATLYESITEVLFKLPGSTLVYPAHDFEGRTSSTIEEERRHNPVVDQTREQFVTGAALHPDAR